MPRPPKYPNSEHAPISDVRGPIELRDIAEKAAQADGFNKTVHWILWLITQRAIELGLMTHDQAVRLGLVAEDKAA